MLDRPHRLHISTVLLLQALDEGGEPLDARHVLQLLFVSIIHCLDVSHVIQLFRGRRRQRFLFFLGQIVISTKISAFLFSHKDVVEVILGARSDLNSLRLT